MHLAIYNDHYKLTGLHGMGSCFGPAHFDTFRKRYFAEPCTLSDSFQLRTLNDKCYLLRIHLYIITTKLGSCFGPILMRSAN